jgi:hypothetical protein
MTDPSWRLIPTPQRIDVWRLGRASRLISSTWYRPGLLVRIADSIASTWSTSIMGSCPMPLTRYMGFAEQAYRRRPRFVEGREPARSYGLSSLSEIC